jgi:hypothetical protein
MLPPLGFFFVLRSLNFTLGLALAFFFDVGIFLGGCGVFCLEPLP